MSPVDLVRLSARAVLVSVGVCALTGALRAGSLSAQDAGRSHGADASSAPSKTAEGGALAALPKAQIWSRIEERSPLLRHCYEERGRPTLSGRVEVQFAIGPDGQLLSAAIERNTTYSPELAECIIDQVRGWHFPKLSRQETLVVSYPFEFPPAPKPPHKAASAPKARPASTSPAPRSVAIPDPNRPGSVEAYVDRFGACGPIWRPGRVPATPPHASFNRPPRADAKAEPDALKPYLYQVETCYVRALEVPRWAKTKGRLRLRLGIAESGSVVATKIVFNQLAPEIGCCVHNAAQYWQFAPGTAFRVVEYSFVLTQNAAQVAEVHVE